MFRIIRFDLLVKYIALATVVVSMGVYALAQTIWFPSLSLFKVVTISSAISSILVMMLLSSFISRKIWAIWSWFDESIYPDLNGSWKRSL